MNSLFTCSIGTLRKVHFHPLLPWRLAQFAIGVRSYHPKQDSDVLFDELAPNKNKKQKEWKSKKGDTTDQKEGEDTKSPKPKHSPSIKHQPHTRTPTPTHTPNNAPVHEHSGKANENKKSTPYTHQSKSNNHSNKAGGTSNANSHSNRTTKATSAPNKTNATNTENTKNTTKPTPPPQEQTTDETTNTSEPTKQHSLPKPKSGKPEQSTNNIKNLSTTSGDDKPTPKQWRLGLLDELNKVILEDYRFGEPTHIQRDVIPTVLKGKNVVSHFSYSIHFYIFFYRYWHLPKREPERPSLTYCLFCIGYISLKYALVILRVH